MSKAPPSSVHSGLIIEIIHSFYRNEWLPLTTIPFRNESDWHNFFSVLRFHKLIPLAHHVLSRMEAWPFLPGDFTQTLEQASFHGAAFLLLLGNFLDAVTRALEKAGIPFYVIKGPSLALEFYQPSNTRPYTDIDIVIPFDSFTDTRTVLNSEGFVSRKTSFNRSYFDSVHFAHEQFSEISIDLQCESVTSIWSKKSFLNDPEVWNRLRLLKSSESRSFPVLNPLHLIPFLCTHLTFHRPMALIIHLLDLALAVRTHAADLDWNELVCWVQNKQLCKPVYYPLKWISETLDCPVPPAVLKAIRPGAVERHLFPFNAIARRQGNMPEYLERVVKFPLIEGWDNKTRAIGSFYRMIRKTSDHD